MKSTVEIIRELSGIVRRIEQDAKGIASRAGGVAAVLERMTAHRALQPGPHQQQGTEPVATPGPS